TSGGATIMGSYPYPRNGIIVMDYEFILIFKKPGDPPRVSQEIKEQSRLSKEQWQEYFSGHWNFGGARQDKHLAMFPVELPRRAIEMFTFSGETVLDPFLGSGTTSLAAMMTGRSSIGYEINKDFLPVIKEKLKIQENVLFNDNSFTIKEQKPLIVDWQARINTQKYIFHDPLILDKKTEAAKRKYGSKINQQDSENGAKRETLYIVKEIIAPDLIKLNNGEIVRLIGIKQIIETQDQAMEFLRKKILKRQVYLKYDNIKHEEQNYTLVYLYLKNKTFINAHLVKNALCQVDKNYNYKYKEKFELLQMEHSNNENTTENS
ncbi:MAG TPA: DNA methyltransferase, partial [bacterium]|nr:DNA methyltransferase [bacterium]